MPLHLATELQQRPEVAEVGERLCEEDSEVVVKEERINFNTVTDFELSLKMITLNPVEKKIIKLLLNCVHDNQLHATLRIAGGWVRDKLLRIESHDLDIVIDKMNGIDFASVLNEYSKSKHLDIGSIGRIKINPDKSKHLETATLTLFGKDVDFVGLRHEVEYTPESRNPAIVTGTPEQDAFRRDITINALFYNIHSQEVEDFTGQVCSHFAWAEHLQFI